MPLKQKQDECKFKIRVCWSMTKLYLHIEWLLLPRRHKYFNREWCRRQHQFIYICSPAGCKAEDQRSLMKSDVLCTIGIQADTVRFILPPFLIPHLQRTGSVKKECLWEVMINIFHYQTPWKARLKWIRVNVFLLWPTVIEKLIP